MANFIKTSLAIGASLIVLSQNANGQKLREIYDKLTIIDDTAAVIDTFTMTSFPYIDLYQQNVTINAKMCYVNQWSNFTERCLQILPKENWIILNPFSQGSSNEVIQDASRGPSNIEGLIFITNDFISSNQTYTQPEIISLISQSSGDKLKKYSYNSQYTSAANDGTNYNISIDHVYINRCFLLNPIWPTYMALTGVWFLILVSWWYYTFIYRKLHSLYMQKTMTIIPVCKILECLIQGLFLNACPWISTTEPSEKYLDMARISIVTITYTILLAILFLISKGWNTTAFQLTRNQATYLTMIMGAVYLTYSAYFLSADFVGISYFMRALMALLYLGLGLTNLKNLRLTVKMIQTYAASSSRDNPNDIMIPALKLKESMLKKFAVCILGYFILKVIKYGIISFLNDETLSERFSLSVQCFDLLFLAGSLFIFRSRVWPSFFRIGMNEINVPLINGQEGQARQNFAPMLETHISPELFSENYIDHDDRCDSIGSNEVVVILNPTRYNIEEDDEEDDMISSLNDSREHIDKPDLEKIEPNDIMQQMKIAYKEKSNRSNRNRANNRGTGRRSIFGSIRDGSDSTDDDLEDDVRHH